MAAARGTIEKRRLIRALETKRDTLLTQQAKAKTELAKVRAELKSVRARA